MLSYPPYFSQHSQVKELHDDYQRYSRDKEANAERYSILSLEVVQAHPQEEDPENLATKRPHPPLGSRPPCPMRLRPPQVP